MASTIPDIQDLKAEPETEDIIANEDNWDMKRPFKHVKQIFKMYNAVATENLTPELSEMALILGGELKVVENQLHMYYNQQNRDPEYIKKVGQTTKCMKSCLVKKKTKDFVALWKSAKDAAVLALVFRRLKRQAGLMKLFSRGTGIDIVDRPSDEVSNQEKVVVVVDKFSEALKRADEFGLTNVGEHILEGAIGLGDELPYIKTALGIISSVYGIFKANATLRAEAMDLLKVIRNVEVIVGGSLVAQNEEQSFLLEQLVEVLELAELYIIQCLLPDQNAIAKILKATARVENIDQLKEEIVKQLTEAMFAESVHQSELLQKLDQKASSMLEMKVTLDQIANRQQEQVEELITIKDNIQELAQGLAPSKYKPASKNFFEIDGYRVKVEGGRHFKTAEGEYVELGSGYNYCLQLRNGTKNRCRAEVKIDDILIGMFALNGEEEYTIERPVTLARRFMFYSTSKGSKIEDSGIEKKKSENGLLECTFTPELVYTFKVCHQNYAGVLSEPLIVDLGPEQTLLDLVKQVTGSVPSAERDIEAYVVNFADQFVTHYHFQMKAISSIYRDWMDSSCEVVLVREIANEVSVINPVDAENVITEMFTCGYSSDVTAEVVSRYGVPSPEDVRVTREQSRSNVKRSFTALLLKGLIEASDPPKLVTLVIFKSQNLKSEVQKALNLGPDSATAIKILTRRDSSYRENLAYRARVVIEKDMSLKVIAFDGRQDTMVVKSSITLSDLKNDLVARRLMEEDGVALVHRHKERGVCESKYSFDELYETIYIAFEGFSDGSEVTVKPTMFTFDVQFRMPGCFLVLQVNIEAYKMVADLREQVMVDFKTHSSCKLDTSFILIRDRVEKLQSNRHLRDLGLSRSLILIPIQMEVPVLTHKTMEKLGSIHVLCDETILLEVEKSVQNLIKTKGKETDSFSTGTDQTQVCLLLKDEEDVVSFYNSMIDDATVRGRGQLLLKFLTARCPVIDVIISQPIQVTLNITRSSPNKTWTRDVETETCATLYHVLKQVVEDPKETDGELASQKVEGFCVSGTARVLVEERKCLAQLGIENQSVIDLIDVASKQLDVLEYSSRSVGISDLVDDWNCAQRRNDIDDIRHKSRQRVPQDEILQEDISHIGDRLDEVHSITEFKISAGATTLQGHTNQDFQSVDNFPLNFSKKIVLALRMVARKGDQHPLPMEEECVPLHTVRYCSSAMVRPVDGSTAQSYAPPPVPDDDDEDDD
ncbi:uncharacterized protein LOC106177399 [Lingula anatina]|uniref:Uncharacterized protein LOC106177399 n=1 Tax=Lingula anatina TaxID=7574 RepID=A0A1S3K011_LINAN|nr:uncharacterized protein LOC106177399 [Lingula anatina]|eukprot:XP_013415611.1 uncharacterized protein LOC106177399 [Lingula anatina]